METEKDLKYHYPAEGNPRILIHRVRATGRYEWRLDTRLQGTEDDFITAWRKAHAALTKKINIVVNQYYDMNFAGKACVYCGQLAPTSQELANGAKDFVRANRPPDEIIVACPSCYQRYGAYHATQ